MSSELPYLRVTRREFSSIMLASGVAITRRVRTGPLQSFDGELVIALLLASKSPENADFASGFTMGIAEASRAADLFGRKVRSLVQSVDASDQIDGAVKEMRRRGVEMIIGTGSEHVMKRLADSCHNAGILLMNGGCRADSMRRSECSPLLFHIEASDAMYESAARLAGTESKLVRLWTPSLERYGAAQLNDRYAASVGSPMSAAAWAGWMSAKVLWEASLRAASTESARIAAFLASPSSNFDGHKGAALSFRQWDHQLRQPLYALDSSQTKVNAEVPDLSRSGESVRELLDTLGDKDNAQRCRSR